MTVSLYIKATTLGLKTAFRKLKVDVIDCIG